MFTKKNVHLREITGEKMEKKMTQDEQSATILMAKTL